MKTFTTRTKTVVATALSLSALTGAALAHAATNHVAAPSVAALEAHVARSGALPGFWSTECPTPSASAGVWAVGDRNEAAALRAEGFVLGVRERLRSESGRIGASVALSFRTAAGATADLERREQLAGHAGYPTNFGVPGLSSARGYTVQTSRLTIVRVAYTHGANEYAVEVQAAGRVNVGALQRAVAAAAVRAAALG